MKAILFFYFAMLTNYLNQRLDYTFELNEVFVYSKEYHNDNIQFVDSKIILSKDYVTLDDVTIEVKSNYIDLNKDGIMIEYTSDKYDVVVTLLLTKDKQPSFLIIEDDVKIVRVKFLSI